MSRARKTVLFVSFALFATWVLCNLNRISANEDWILRFVLGTLFAPLIMFRPKRDGEGESSSALVSSTPIIAAGVGVVLALAGIIFGVNQFEWLGIVLLLYACLAWALPAGYKRDVLLAVFILYWVHPLPGQIFGKFELAMQWMSVTGAERILHTLNERVWVDGMILHTGLSIFGVPESCSGMRTAVTVMLCVLGTGILMRVRWYNVLVFLFLGLVQVMALNILRVSFMVLWADNMPEGWGGTFLHDTLGIFLLISILLVQMEVVLWRKFISRKRTTKKAIEAGEAEPADKASIFPVFWQYVFAWGKYVLLVLFLLLGTAFFLYKQRPYHRAMMYYDVADGLMKGNPALAEKAIDEALQLLPRDQLLQERRIYVLITREKPALVLEELEKFGPKLSLKMTIMKSWALMCLGRVDEAVLLLDGLSEDIQSWPRVAMIKAEHAALQDKPDEVRRNILLAASDGTVLNRVRMLFMYLASRNMWAAIADADNTDVPYNDFTQALVSIKANILERKFGVAGKVMKHSLARWPDEVRLLTSLFELAKRKGGGEWVELFDARLRDNIDNLDVDRLAAYVDYSMQLRRPDLAWLAYSKLSSLDPQDPMVYLAVAQHMDEWLIFRKHQLGLEGDRDDLINVRPLFKLTADIEPYSSLWESVPMVSAMSAEGIKSRVDYMHLALAELQKLEKEKKLSKRMHVSYPMVLAYTGDFKRAHLVQDDVARKYPELKGESLLKQATFYGWGNKWDEAYEVLREYYGDESYPVLDAEVSYVNVLMSLDFAVAAMAVADRAILKYPDSPEVKQLKGMIWMAFDFKEDALHVFKELGDTVDSRVMTQLLSDTGRYSASAKLSKESGFRPVLRPGFDGVARVVPAEKTVDPVWPVPLTNQQMDAEAARIEKGIAERKGSFLQGHDRLVANWYRKRGVAKASDIDAWLDIARNDLEKAAALSRLASMLARQKDHAGAMKVVSRALEFVPESAMLHRLMIGLSAGDADVVDAARKACPDDSIVWLASLVSRCNAEEDKDVLDGKLLIEMRAIVDNGKFSIGVFVRAGDFLLRESLTVSAEVLARHTVDVADGYVPAYIFGMKSAFAVGDTKWALKCALLGAEHALDATPFYRMVIAIKSFTRTTDSDMVQALQYLEERFPKEDQWTEGLGYALFAMGDIARSKRVMNDLFRRGINKDTNVGTLMLAAEAARHEMEPETAVRILKNVYDLHPDNFKVLNNLVYNLAQDPETIGEARALLPKLLEIAGDEFVVYDTAAMVHLRSGQVGVADRYMAKALSLLNNKSYAAVEVRLNSAEVMFRMGNIEQAKEELQAIKKREGISSLLNSRASELLMKINREEKKRN